MWAAMAWAGQGFPYPVESRALDNGLQVHVVPMPSPGVVAFGTWMSVGSRDEVHPGRTGFAHFFEHLMFLGTPTWPGDARDRAILRMGADDNAWTWLDETVYHVTLPTAHLADLVAIEADRFQHLQLTEEQVRREAGAVYGEFRKGRSNPDELLDEALHGAAFAVHTYGHSTIGTEADIRAMPEAWAYAAQFFAGAYRPERARVLVVGDVEPAEVFAQVEAAWGGWRVEGPSLPPPSPEPPQQGVRRVEVPWAAPIPPRVWFGWRIPGHRPEAREAAALELLEQLLLSDVGPLRRRLVDEEALAWSVGGGAEAFFDPCLFVVAVDLREGADPARAEVVVREEVARLVAGMTDADLLRFKLHVRRSWLASMDDPLEVLMAVGAALRRGSGPDALDAWLTGLEEVTAAEVAEVARRYLTDSGLTVATLRPGGP